MNTKRMAEIIGITPVEERIGYRSIEQVDCGGYVRERIVYCVQDREIPAFLLLPKERGPLPGVLINHQHNRQYHLGKSEVCGMEGNPLQAFGARLAERGFVAICPDAICFEDRREFAHGTEVNQEQDDWEYFLALCNGVMTGNTIAKIAIEDAMGAISVLNGLEQVDKTRIGCLGHSYGGNTTYFVTALDQRIRYALSSGSVVSYQSRIDHHTGIEKASIIPGFLREFEIVDVIRAIVPRPFMMLCADDDKWSKDAPEIYQEALKEYTARGAGELLEIKEYSGGHALTEERTAFILDWICRVGRKQE